MSATTPDAGRQDLAALLSRLTNVLVEREAPILGSNGLSMWEYVILLRVEAQDGLTQKELAHTSRRDPTRLGTNLDALEERGYITREQGPSDRRQRLVRITDPGRSLLAQVRGEIAAMEHDALGSAAPNLRAALVAALEHGDAH